MIFPEFSVSVPITRDNLPQGYFWERDGACWSAEVCEPHPTTGQDWRWVPRNFLAFQKSDPEGDMAPYPMHSFGDVRKR